MVLILSHEGLDYPTDAVLAWLNYYEIDCKRINGKDLLEKKPFCFSVSTTANGGIRSTEEFLDMDKIKAVWIRRWMSLELFSVLDLSDPNVWIPGVVPNKDKDNNGQDVNMQSLTKEINLQLENEFRAASHYLFELLKTKHTLGNPFYSAANPTKAKQLLLATEVKMDIPETIVTNSKKTLIDFKKKHQNVICKNISEIGFFHMPGSISVTYTGEVNDSVINVIRDYFYPSLFQKAIPKVFEVRVFYLCGEIYSMAIFSASDEKTKTDFRNYNSTRPNRMVPLQLPSSLEAKIRLFMSKANLKTGSLDFIYSQEGQYVFLEVNPGGQFGMVSHHCNYHLERKVAEQLQKMQNS